MVPARWWHGSTDPGSNPESKESELHRGSQKFHSVDIFANSVLFTKLALPQAPKLKICKAAPPQGICLMKSVKKIKIENKPSSRQDLNTRRLGLCSTAALQPLHR